VSPDVSEEEVKELFTEFGEVLRFKMLAPFRNGGHGRFFIAFDTKEKAS
jgi:RNA recognition motif-containing protein